MALSNQEKAGILDSFLASLERDIYVANLQLSAYQAEVAAAADENSKAAAQANVDGQTNNLNSMKARQAAWQAERDKLKI